MNYLTALACFLAACCGVAILRHMRRRPFRPEPMEFEEPPRVSTRIFDGLGTINHERETP